MALFSFDSLRAKLIFLVLIAVIPALILTFYTGLEQRRHARLDALDNALDLAKKVSDDQERLIERTHQLLVDLAKMDQALECQSSGYSPFLAGLLKEYPFYTNFGVTGPDGQVICSALPMKQPVNFADREWFTRTLSARKFTVSEYLIGRITGKPSIVLSYPIFTGTDYLKAVVFAGLDLAWINQIFAKAQLPPGSVHMVVDRKGTILSRHPDPEKWVGRSLSDTPIVQTILTRQGEGTVEMVGIDSVLRLYAFTPLSNRKEVGAYVAVGIPSTVAFAKVNRILFWNLALLVLASILALVATWWFGGFFIMGPVNRLLNTTKRLADGDLTVRTGSSYPPGEIGQLAQSFDQMAESLQRREAERKQKDEELRVASLYARSLIEASLDPLVTISPNGKITDVNKTTEQVTGVSRERLVGSDFSDYFTEPDKAREGYKQVFSQGTVKDYPLTIRHASGRTTDVLYNASIYKNEAGVVQGVFAAARDITERKRAEEEKAVLEDQLRQAQKVEAIGRLAGGIAHDFNNLLTIIKGNSQLSLMEIKRDDPLRENIEQVEKAADRAAALTRQLLAFSRRQVLEMRVLDLNTTLRDLEKMLRRVIGEDIGLVTFMAEDLGNVKADPGQMEQVIMNLAVNARDAMLKGGKLTIETTNVDLDENYARNHVAVTPGSYVMLSVSDTGVGMTPEVKAKLFEPFFTTKEKGKGTGLGLSTVYGIVKQSGGNIWVYSEPGQGTTFKIYLPRVDEPLEEAGERVVQKELPCGGETILVVEDEEKVRQVTV